MHAHPAELARRWVEQAKSDFIGAEGMIALGRHDLACFLAQQVAEKALKGLLLWLRGDAMRGHVIATLVREVRQVSDIPASVFENIEMLDQYYVATRYPDALGGALPSTSFVKVQSVAACELAKNVLLYIDDYVPMIESQSFD